MITTMDDGGVPRRPEIPYLVVAASLRERLDAGEWLPGEQMPSATELAAEYGISRTTAARAVRVLAEESRVTVVRNWGAFVAEHRATGKREP
jgi:DNA-binding GntR family transcriptional regulator